MIKKRILLSVLAIATSVLFSIGMLYSVNSATIAKADEDDPAIAKTNFSISTDGDYIALVTPLIGEDFSAIYEVGYTFEGDQPEIETYDLKKCYTSVNGKTAKDLFGDSYTDETPMIVWEIINDESKTFVATAYYKQGELIDGLIYHIDDEHPELDIHTGTERTLKIYTITWNDYDDTELKTTKVAHGSTPNYGAADPSREDTAQYSYEFDGWDPELVAAEEDATYTATYSETLRQYTVTFQNYDGTELQSGLVNYGATPVYSGATPTKASSVQNDYTFDGWDEEVVAITGDATYTATYSETIRQYTITFQNYDGTELQSGLVNYGATPVYSGATPTKASTAQYDFAFDGWNADIVAVTGDATYTATYSETLRQYTVTFRNYDETVLQSGLVDYGATPVYSGSTPTKTAEEYFEYSFAGWDKNITTVDESATYTATYDIKLRKDLVITDNGSTAAALIDTEFDLNGYTLTYTSDRAAVSSLITTLNGTVSNGKIVVNCTNASSGAIVFGNGSGKVKDVEFDITINGTVGDGSVLVLFGGDPVSIAFEDCVIKTNVTDSKVSFIYAGEQAYPNHHIASSWTNVIAIDNMANFGFDIYGLGVTFGGASISGNTIYAENMAGLHHYASLAAYMAAEYDVSDFDSNIWAVSKLSNLPSYGEISGIEISNASELKAISGVSGKYYILTDDITVVDDGSAAISSLDSILDLNGHTLTYTSSSTAVSSLIGTLSGVIGNGKMVVNCTNTGSYAGGSIIFGGGSGAVQDIEFDITVAGSADNIVVLFGFDPVSISFEDCVIKTNVTDSRVSFIYAGEQALPNHHIASSWTNVIAIDNMANFGFDIYGLGVTFGGASISGNTIYAENMAGLHHYASLDAYIASGYDVSDFDTNIWSISKLTNLPNMGGIEISNASELKAISGVSGKYYILTDDITVVDDGSAAISSLDSILDLNGHTLTYTSDRTAVSPLINALNGIIGNGKIVVNSTNTGSYTAHCSIIFMNGSGTVQDVEFDITVAGSADNIVALFGFEPAISFKDCVIKTNVTDSRVSFIYAGTQGYENHSIESKWVNVISIGNIANFAYDIWGTGVRFDGTRIAGGYINTSTMAGLHHYASVAAYTAANYDTSSFNTNIWTINTTTNLPELKKK